jgi:hypothetical protein
MSHPSSPQTPQAISAGWLGVVGSRESLDRLLHDGEHWWCFPAVAQVGSFVAMYCTGQASKSHHGVFAVFRLEAFDAERNSECKRYGSSSGYGSTAFALLRLVKRIDPPLASKLLRADPILSTAQCVRRSFQGTFFALEAREVKRLTRLAGITDAVIVEPAPAPIAKRGATKN